MTTPVFSYNAEMPRWMQGNAAAIDLNNMIYGICETWDDLIDGDKVTPEGINAAFYAACIVLPRNPFYREHFAALSSLFEAAILDWYAANALEKVGTLRALQDAYVIRGSLQHITVMCARIIGGVDWANIVNLELHTHGEGFEEYAAEFGVK